MRARSLGAWHTRIRAPGRVSAALAGAGGRTRAHAGARGRRQRVSAKQRPAVRSQVAHTRLSKQTWRSHKHSLCPTAITWWTLTTTLRSVRAGPGRPTLSSSIHDGWREGGTTSLSYRGADWAGRAPTCAVTVPACTSSASHARLGCDIDSLKKREGGPLASGGGVTERRDRPTSRPNERGQTQGSEDSLRIGPRLSSRLSFCAERIRGAPQAAVARPGGGANFAVGGKSPLT